jgi:hypothetical protein
MQQRQLPFTDKFHLLEAINKRGEEAILNTSRDEKGATRFYYLYTGGQIKMSRRIGIITILKVNNYGAELQAYATQFILNKLGYKAEIIDYLFYKHPQHNETRMSAPLFPFGIRKRLSEYLYPTLVKIKSWRYTDKYKLRKKRFEVFHQLHTAMSKTYNSIDLLYGVKLDYDVYMVGSDQVWNPGIYSSLEPYFLTFAPKGKKRISYASSFGVSSISKTAQPYYQERLKKFDAISVREINAVSLVKQLSGMPATWVLDPTLLLNKKEWQRVANDAYNVQGNYILQYAVTPCSYMLELGKWLSASLGYKIIQVYEDAGPSEFIDLFDKASVVITNSFHGTAFSINFEKDFYTVIPRRKANNSRQLSLAQKFGLEDRILLEGAAMPNIENLHIDYTEALLILENERNKSINFLTNAIDG